MAHERIEKMKKETGRITNVELQRKVTASFLLLAITTKPPTYFRRNPVSENLLDRSFRQECC